MNDAGVDFEEDSYSFKRKVRTIHQYEDAATPKMILFLSNKYNISKDKAKIALLLFSVVCFLLAIIIPVVYFFF